MKSNVIAFPLERAKARALARRLFRCVDGKIVAVPATGADTIALQEALEHLLSRMG